MRGLMDHPLTTKYMRPFSWRDLDWKFFASYTRLLQTGGLILGGTLMEANSFFLLNAFRIPSAHWFLKARLVSLMLLSMGAVTEFYEFVRLVEARKQENAESQYQLFLGHNVWLVGMIIIVELATVAKYGHFLTLTPPLEICVPFFLFAVMFGTWSFFKINRPKKKTRDWRLNLLGLLSMCPLLYFCKFWQF